LTKSPDDPAIRINGGFSVQLFILQISFPFVATACTTNGTNNVINAAYPRYAYHLYVWARDHLFLLCLYIPKTKKFP